MFELEVHINLIGILHLLLSCRPLFYTNKKKQQMSLSDI